MGLVQNSKKKLKNVVERTLVGLSSLFIRHLAKQILKRPASSSLTTSSPSPLTTEPPPTIIATSSQGTSKRIIMDQTIEVVAATREWVMDRLADPDLEYKDAMALADEFKEWINPKEDEIDILSIPE
jgi:hypothetical protein